MPATTCLEELRIAYDEAFEHLRAEVNLLNSLRLESNPNHCERLRLRVEDAERSYRQKRDDLADYIIAQQPRSSAMTCCA